MTEFQFILQDRIQKIKSIDEQLNLQKNAYIAFSGGKDSTVLHYLIDEALPQNKIPRVFSDTGLEFKKTREFVLSLAKNDERIKIVTQTKNIRDTLEKYGYPFKSKRFARNIYQWNKGNRAKWLIDYIDKELTDKKRRYTCPKKLIPMFDDKLKFNVSDLCCEKLKKNLQKEWQAQNNKTIVITGIRREEGGNRENAKCLAYNNTHFNPLVVCSNEWMKEYIENKNIQLSKLYYAPYNFTRTGCIGCPFAINIKEELKILKENDPAEYKRAELIWGRVYDWYRFFKYRLKKEEVKNDLGRLFIHD